MVMEAHNDSLEESHTKKMFVSLHEILTQKRKKLLDETSKHVASISSHQEAVINFSKTSFEDFEKSIKGAQNILKNEN